MFKKWVAGVGVVLVSACAHAQVTQPPSAPAETPLKALPYSPSFDRSSMDLTVDPCVDFYSYTCGSWMKKNPIPADKSSFEVYGKLYNDNQRFLWGILNDLARGSDDRTPDQRKLGDYFSACMDEAKVEKEDAAPIAPALERIRNLKERKALAGLLAALHLEQGSHGTLFDFSSGQDYGDSEGVIAFASAGGLGLPDRDYYVKTDTKSVELRKKYAVHVRRILGLLGDSEDVARKEALTVLRIETALAKASLTLVEKRDPHNLFHKMTRGQLKALTPGFDWEAYLAALGMGEVRQFNVSEPKFFQEVQRIIQTTPLGDLKTYLRWHVASDEAPYLSSRFVNESFDFYSRTLRGVQALPPRWKRCVGLVDDQLGEALGKEFVARAFGPEMKRATVEMTDFIEKAMEKDVNGLPWMSPTTKQKAIAKLHAVRNKVGYPEKWRDYSAFDVRAGDFLGNVRRGTTFEVNRQLAKIGKPLDRTEWGMTPPTVNAYYDPQMNDINFPAGVLEPPLYDPKMDDAPNYGNTGGTIGHELTHGFDDEGRQFDGQGNLKDWWTKEDAAEFSKRTECIVGQYGTYTVIDDIKINSRLTLGEDVADLGGLILAYMAWKEATKDSDLKDIDGFSPDQRFFVGFAQWACENQRPESLRLHAATDPHSPGKYRINGVVANMPEFQEAFSCRAGQPMVNEPRCRVW